jgi:hypothetical protein
MTEVFNIQLPDGRVVGIQANSPVEAAQGAKNIMMREGRTTEGKGGGVDNFGRALARGASLGFADEFAAGADATVGPYVDWLLKQANLGTTNTSTAPTWDERYTQNLGGERAQDTAYDAAYPVTSTAGKIGGGIAGTLAAAPQALISAGGKGLLGAAKAAGAGGTIGGIAGFGEGEGGLANRAENAGFGAGIGAVTGGVLNPVANLGGSVLKLAAETKPGRYLADKAGSAVNMMANVADRFAPKIKPQNVEKLTLSSAAPEGGALPAADNMMTRTADALRSVAPDSEEILKNAAARRIAREMTLGGTSDIPGFRVRQAELGPDFMPLDVNLGTQRLGRTVHVADPAGARTLNAALDARNTRAPDRFMSALGDEANVPPIAQAREFLDLNRQKVGAEAYAEMRRRFAIDEPVLRDSPQLKAIFENPAVQGAIKKVTDAETGARVGRPDARPASEIEIMHEVKRAIQELGIGPTGRPEPGAFWWSNLANDFVSELKKANPKLADADRKYSQAASLFTSRHPREGILTKGQDFMRAGTSEGAIEASPAALAADLPKYDPMQFQTFKVGATNTMKDIADAGPDATRALGKKIITNRTLQGKLREIYGADTAERMIQQSLINREMAGIDKVVRGGPDTAGKLVSAADDALVGDVPTTAGGIVKKILGSLAETYKDSVRGNAEVRGEIARMLTTSGVDASEDLITRIAAQLSMEAKRGKAIQRGVSGTTGGALSLTGRE